MHRLAYPRVPANAARLRSPNREASIKKTKRTGKPFFLFFGRGDKIRTCDFYVPNVALYQAEPHLDGGFLGFFCKWSNIWSEHLHRELFKIGYCHNMQCFQGRYSVFARSFGIMPLARSALLPAGAPRR